jgi:hypothetical protein
MTPFDGLKEEERGVPLDLEPDEDLVRLLSFAIDQYFVVM